MQSVNVIAQEIFCGAKYTHHTFTSNIKQQIKWQQYNVGEASFINKYMKNQTKTTAVHTRSTLPLSTKSTS